MFHRLLLATLTAAVAAFPVGILHAGIVLSLDTGRTIIGWRGATAEVVLSAYNNGNETATMQGLNFGLQVVPIGSVVGGVEVTGVAAPTSDSAWTDSATLGPDPATLANGPINGTSDYWSMSVAASDNAGSIPAGEWRNLAVVILTLSGDPNDATFSAWDIYVVNEYPEAGTALTATTLEDFSTIQFSNLTLDPSTSPGSAVNVATLHVVPEPTGVTLVTTVSVAVFALARRRRRRR